MSATTQHPSTSTTITSLQNPSTTKDGNAGPIAIGASIASVAAILSLIFLVFYLKRRRQEHNACRYSIKSEPEVSLTPMSKLDYLPREPSPPPPPYKDTDEEKDLESGMQPPVPPKDLGERPFVSARRISEEEAYAEHGNVRPEATIRHPAPAFFMTPEGGMF